MKRKILSSIILGILLLTSTLSFSAVGIKVNISETQKVKDNSLDDPIDLISLPWYDDDGKQMPSPYIFEGQEDEIAIYCFYGDIDDRKSDKSFDIAYYWNDETMPFHISKYCKLDYPDYGSGYDLFNLPHIYLPSKNKYTNLQIRIKLDYSNDIAESNDYPDIDAEENNIYYSNIIENPKPKTIRSLFTNILEKILNDHPYIFPRIRTSKILTQVEEENEDAICTWCKINSYDFIGKIYFDTSGLINIEVLQGKLVVQKMFAIFKNPEFPTRFELQQGQKVVIFPVLHFLLNYPGKPLKNNDILEIDSVDGFALVLAIA